MMRNQMKNYDHIEISDASDESDQENRSNISSTPKSSSQGYGSKAVCKSFSEEYASTTPKLAKSTRLLSKSFCSRSQGPSISGGKKRRRTNFKPLEVKVERKSLDFLSYPSQLISSPSLKPCNSKFSFHKTIISPKLFPKVEPGIFSSQNSDDTDIECCSDEEDLNETIILNHDVFKFECSTDEIECSSDDSNNNSLEVSNNKKFKKQLDNIKLEKSICDEIDNESDEDDLNLSLLPSCARDKIRDSNSELDEFLALIEIENRQLMNRTSPVILFRNATKTNLMRCRKSGYLEELQKILDTANTDCKYLLHDKNFDLHNGNIYSIVKINRLFGVNLMTLKSESLTSTTSSNNNQLIRTVIPISWSNDIKVGQLVEFCPDETIKPYCLDTRLNTFNYNVYLQPNKLIFLR